MSEEIECPVCNFVFTPEFNDAGMCHCPSCEIQLMFESSNHGQHFPVSNFEECMIESSLIKLNVENLDDDCLEDEITEEITINDYCKETFQICTEMSNDGFMSYDSRKRAEGVYILMHSVCKFGSFH